MSILQKDVIVPVLSIAVFSLVFTTRGFYTEILFARFKNDIKLPQWRWTLGIATLQAV